MQYGPKIVTDSLVLALDAADNNSAPHNDLPVKQGCIGWYDGDDSTVFSYSSGTAVSEWRDKSGNSNHLTMSNGPTRSVTQNSKSGLAFNGSSQWGNAVTGGAISETTMIAVCSLATLTPSGSNSGGGVVSVNQHSADNFNAIVYNEYTAKRWMNGSSSWTRTPNTVSTSDETSTGPHIISNAIKTGAFNLYRNGTNLTSTSYTYSAQTNGKIVIGNRHTNSSNNPVSNGYWYGNIYEVIVYDRVLSSDELTKVHNYLQNKWNIKVSDSRWYSQTANGYTFGKGGDPVFYETNKGHFDFDGSDDRMDIPGSDRIQYSTSEAWTHEIVIDPGSSGIATSWNGIFGGYLNVGGYWMFHNGGQLSWYDAIISGSGRLWYTGLYLGTDIPYDTITHITITHDGSAGFKVFINGVQQRSTTRTFETSYSADLKIIGAGDSNRYGTSKIYLFRNYSKQLSDAEILQNYNVTKARFT